MRHFLAQVGFLVVNLWLLFHLFSIVVGPASVSPSSETIHRGWELSRHYLQAMYLNHGWHFFSPQPGGATLLRFEMTAQNGETTDFTFPQRAIEPRLLYHRYFMVSEFFGGLPEDSQRIWAEAFARKMFLQDNAQHVRITKIFHDLPTPEWVLAGGHLDDPELFEETIIGEFDRHDFPQEGQ